MESSPYRSPPDPPLCGRCRVRVADARAEPEIDGAAPICRFCADRDYDLLAIVSVATVMAGAITGSGVLLACGLLVPAIGVCGIRRRDAW